VQVRSLGLGLFQWQTRDQDATHRRSCWCPTALSFERPLLRELTPLLLRWWLVYFIIILEAIEFFFQLGNLRRVLRIIIGIVHFRRVPFQVVEYPFFAARHIHAIEANELVAFDLGSRAGRYELAKLSEYAKRVLGWLFSVCTRRLLT